MDMFVSILIICLIASFVTIRNYWVFSARGEIKIYHEYLSYDQMMLRIWIWNIEKMKLKEYRKGGIVKWKH